MPIKPPYFPIVYVRGFAATMKEIEETTATPYMGFNLGSTKIRQDFQGQIVPFIFESPLIRLMKERGYRDAYQNGGFIEEGQEVSAKSIWIFRYYEKASESLGTGKRSPIEAYAEELRVFILRIRRQVCGQNAAARNTFKVYLVAHSMGGLICRCYLQNICRDATVDAVTGEAIPAGTHFVDKVFTYATPHNGIDFKGINAPDLGRLDPFYVKNFNRSVMKAYLKLPAQAKQVNSLDGAFPEDRFFSFVGTDYRDYQAFFGLSKRATGPMSDGLVMMQNAYVAGTPRAYAHRSHSGHFGIVNSEEGFQNLTRFFFGHVGVWVLLDAQEITLPEPIEALKDQGKQIRASYYIETTCHVRGLQVPLNERRVDQSSAMLKSYDRLVHNAEPIYLFSGYLDRTARKSTADRALCFAISIAIMVPVYEVDRKFWFDDHFEGGRLFSETINFRVYPKNRAPANVYCGLASEVGMGVTHRRLSPTASPHGQQYDIPLGFKPDARRKPRPGFRGRLLLHARPW